MRPRITKNVDKFEEPDGYLHIKNDIPRFVFEDLYLKRPFINDLFFIDTIGVGYLKPNNKEKERFFFVEYDFLDSVERVTRGSELISFVIVNDMGKINDLSLFMEEMRMEMKKGKNIKWGVKYEDWDKWVAEHGENNTGEPIGGDTKLQTN